MPQWARIDLTGTIALQIGGRVKQPGLVEIPLAPRWKRCWIGLAVEWRPALDSRRCRWAARSAVFSRIKNSISRSAMTSSPEAGAILGHGGIVVFDDETDMVEMARHFMAFTADESCGKCTPCRIGSVRARDS